MAQHHVSRLEPIIDECRVVRQILRDELNRLASNQAPKRLQKPVDSALSHLSDTYFARLVAEFESLLRDHLINHFSNVSVGNRDGYFSLVVKSRTRWDSRNPGAKAPGHLVDRVPDLRSHRNNQAHGLPLSERRPDAEGAFVTLAKYAALLNP